MIKLYEYGPSGNCYKVRLLLTQLNIHFERVECVERNDHLLEKSPFGVAPFVEFSDGRILGESNAIIWHFSEGTKFLPEDSFERAQVLQWMFFEQYMHEPNIATSRFWISFAGMAKEKAKELEEKKVKGYAALDFMEKHLKSRRFFVGDKYTIADIALYAYTHVAEEGGFSLKAYPSISKWLDQVKGTSLYVEL